MRCHCVRRRTKPGVRPGLCGGAQAWSVGRSPIAHITRGFADRPWREPGVLAERRRKGAGLAKAQIDPDLRHRHRGIGQQRLGLLDAQAAHVAVRRQAEGLLERPHEMKGAQPHDVGQRGQRNVVREVLLDVLRNLLLLPAGEPASNVLPFGSGAVVETQQLVHHHDAERLGILALIDTRILGLRLELGGCLPQVLVEEEQTRLELPFGKTQLGVDQWAAWIDVEVGDARQHPRLLPAEKPVAGGNEAQLPAEIVQGRRRQTFDQCLAVIPLRAFGHDQQMMGRPIPYSNGSRRRPGRRRSGPRSIS